MKIDIIGSKFSRKLTEFKNFGFDVNYIVEGQSILSLLSKPYETTMKEINTTDLNEITVAYRDLNKLLYPELKKSKAKTIMIDLLSELNELVTYENSFYNASSFKLINSKPTMTSLSNIQKFRAIHDQIDLFIELLNQYEKVIILKVLPKEGNEREFINGLYKLIEDKVNHKLILSVNKDSLNSDHDAPLEIYSSINQDLKKFSSDNYFNQLLFDEKLVDDTLSIYINHVEKRKYIYELYKDGKPFKKYEPTTARNCSYKLDESGKYRVRVTILNSKVNPRFSQTYQFSKSTTDLIDSSPTHYIEMPEEKNFWMLDIILQNSSYKGLIGNAYKYPFGYDGYSVYLSEEINTEYLTKDKLLTHTLDIISKMSKDEFNHFLYKHAKSLETKNHLYVDFLRFIQKNQE